MRNKGIIIYLLIFLFQINFSFLEYKIIYNEQRDNKNNSSIISSNFTKEDTWNCTWDINVNEYGAAIAIDSSKNVYLAGTIDNFITRDQDIFLVKYNCSGAQQWNYTWNRYEDYCIGITIDAFDNIYVAGDSHNYSAGRYDIFLIKFNTSGQEEWTRIWGGDSNDVVNAITTDSLGNIYLLGKTASFSTDEPMLLAKYNSSGILQWIKFWDTDDGASGYAISVDSFDDIYIAGISSIFEEIGGNIATKHNIFLIKYNSMGGLQWVNKWRVNEYNLFSPMLLDSSVNLYITGYTNDSKNVLVKYNISGVLQWYHILNQTSGCYTDIALDSVENIYLTGVNVFCFEWTEIFIRKFNNSGILLWEGSWKEFGYAECNAITLDSMDNIYLTGSSEADAFIVKNPQLGPISPYTPTPCFQDYGIIIDYNLIIFILGIGIISIIITIKRKEKLKIIGKIN